MVHLRRCSARNARHSSVVAHSQMVIGLSVTVRITLCLGLGNRILSSFLSVNVTSSGMKRGERSDSGQVQSKNEVR